jgi:hypothetical protein
MVDGLEAHPLMHYSRQRDTRALGYTVHSD